ncbi:VanW family protein [Nonomuraea lactucae]|uniref:VanW family protein n=1 Tax=Nonomuraea lactucae TaxID=2249762 RepID=UPI000DE1EC48|nr:VanW family protein [Nonomuraea lactucae]
MKRILGTARSRVAAASAVVVAVPLLAYGMPALALAGEVPPDTSAGGVDIGGLSPQEARARLEEAYGRLGPLAVEAAGRTVRMRPRDLGVTLDAGATVARAMDGSTTPAGVARSLFGTRTVPPAILVDDRRLSREIAELARKIDRKPQEGHIAYRGLEPQATMPKTGRALDRPAAARAIRDAFLARRDEVTLPMREVPPAVPAAKVREVADTTARSAVAAPLTLVAGSEQATLSRSRLASDLRFVPDGRGGLRPSYDVSEAVDDVRGELIEEDQRPRDATFRIAKGRPQVVPSRPGRDIDPDALGKAIGTALATGERTVNVPVTEARPGLTTEKARRLGVRQRVSTYTTNHPCCAPRVTNIHRIAEIVDGHLVMPGQTFSLNGLVGKRDRARGFVKAPMIMNGRFVNDVGGGVSQFATTMFNAVFFGGFEDVQHTPHQFYISRYPAGRESTVSYPQPDFRWRNDSPYGVLIKTSYTDTSITVQFWSTKRFDIESRSSERYNVKDFPKKKDSAPDCLPMEGVEGFDIDVWRIFKKGGEVVRKQRFHTVYQPEPRLTCTATET